MKKNIVKNLILSSITVIVVLVMVLVFSTIVPFVKAGSLTAPGSSAPTMYTLQDLHNLITNNTATTEGNHNLSPSASPSGTMFTLTQIYNNLANLIDPAKVLTNTTYLGVTGTAKVSTSLIWSADPSVLFCWDANQGCTNGNGAVYNNGNTKLLGAVEYCKYLLLNGSTIAATEQDIWRLPTESELLAGLSDQYILNLSSQQGFQSNNGGSYWSGSEADSSHTWAAYGLSDLAGSSSDFKNNQLAVRCVR